MAAFPSALQSSADYFAFFVVLFAHFVLVYFSFENDGGRQARNGLSPLEGNFATVQGRRDLTPRANWELVMGRINRILRRTFDLGFSGSPRQQHLRRRRPMQIEALENRSLLAVLVADALSGTSNTRITGTVYEDLERDGVVGPDDQELQDWTLYLDLDNSGTLNTDAAGVTEPTVTTDQDGKFSIRFLKPGTYRISEIVPPGWTPTAPASRDVVVTQGNSTPADFFNFAGGHIVGTAWNDQQQDGIRDIDPDTGEFSDPPLAGWTIFLDLNQDELWDASEPSTTTDADGHYSFRDLPPSDYEVMEILPEGWEPTEGYDIRQTAGVVALETTQLDFANFSLTNGSLSGTVWHDVNINGIRDIDPDTGEFSEPGLQDWVIFLDINQDGLQDVDEPQTTTDADGHYVFVSLASGDYRVTEILPDGWAPSPEFGTSVDVTVNTGEESIADDLANFNNLNGSLRGVIWNDVNRNSVRDTLLSGEFSEPGLMNWQVALDLNRNGVHDDFEPLAITDANGEYIFTDLQVGEYEIFAIIPTGWEVSPTFSDSHTVQVYPGTTSIAPDFANYQVTEVIAGSVAGTIWNDLNGNGIRDLNLDGSYQDVGLSSWNLFADLNGNGSPDAGEPTAMSGADGLYQLTGVLPGTVAIIATPRPGWRPTAPITGSRIVVLRNDDNLTGLDFGQQRVNDGVIRGRVFADTNHDGTLSVGERGLAEMQVFLDLDDNGLLDAGEPSTHSSADLFYTPGTNEAGTYSFTHLAAGTYTVRTVLTERLSATPASELVHVVTLGEAETKSDINTAARFRSNEIHGIRFDDRNGNHLRDADELGVAGVTVYIDLDRDNSMDIDERSAVTGADGSYSFTNLTPGSYVVREVESPEVEHTYPTTMGGILWPDGTSNPAVGNVDPNAITTSLAEDESYRQTVSITLPNNGAVTNLVDVFLLFDDTGSFVNNSPIVRAAFPDIIASLQSTLAGIDLAFGVGRFEEYGNFAAEYDSGRPFVLNQPMVAATTPGYLASIQAALNRTTPGYGGDEPETDIEALYQLVTGIGFDGNNNGSLLDSGPAGLASTQLSPGGSGDVPPFASFRPDPSDSILPAAGTVGGAGFRSGALPIILTATDTGFAYQPKGETDIIGTGGLTLPLGMLTNTSRPTTPFGLGAGIQETVTALNALGALVIGLGTNPEPNFDPRQGLESLSKLTGAINKSAATIPNGTANPIAPGDPLYFEIASGFATSVADGVVNAIQNAVTSVAVDIDVRASDPRVQLINHSGIRSNVTGGQTATFDIEFVGDGVPRRFDLQFVRAGTNVVLGSIPVVLGTPIPGDGYEYEDLEEGEIELHSDFGGREAIVVPTATEFVVVEGLRRRIFTYDDAGTLAEEQRVQRQLKQPTGIATNPDATLTWVLDSNGIVQVLDQADTFVGSWRAKGLSKPEGITTDGTHLWIVDRGSDSVSFFANAAALRTGSLQPTSTFPLVYGNNNPTDITTDGTILWVLNDATKSDKVYRYQTSGTADGSWTISPENSRPTGLTLDRNNPSGLWIVDARTDRIYLYDGGMDWINGTHLASTSLALNANNRDPQGIATRNIVVTPVAAAAASDHGDTNNSGTNSAAPRAALADHSFRSNIAIDAAFRSYSRPSSPRRMNPQRRGGVQQSTTIAQSDYDAAFHGWNEQAD